MFISIDRPSGVGKSAIVRHLRRTPQRHPAAGPQPHRPATPQNPRPRSRPQSAQSGISQDQPDNEKPSVRKDTTSSLHGHQQGTGRGYPNHLTNDTDATSMSSRTATFRT
jgi:hypothetical protein